VLRARELAFTPLGGVLVLLVDVEVAGLLLSSGAADVDCAPALHKFNIRRLVRTRAKTNW
jgi:hypothetical protein